MMRMPCALHSPCHEGIYPDMQQAPHIRTDTFFCICQFISCRKYAMSCFWWETKKVQNCKFGPCTLFIKVFLGQGKVIWTFTSDIWRPEHLSASSSWTGTGTSPWQEMHLVLKQAQESRGSRQQARLKGRDREGCEEDLCVWGPWATTSGGDESPPHSGLAKPRCPLGSSISRLTIFTSSTAHCYAPCSWVMAFIDRQTDGQTDRRTDR